MPILPLMLFHYALLLLYGAALSFAFAGIEPNKRNGIIYLILVAASGSLQLGLLYLADEAFVWLAYPIVTHLPIVAVLCLVYRKRILTALAAVTTAYLCCQPANWLGVLVDALSDSLTLEISSEIVALICVGFLMIRFAATSLARLYNKDNHSILIFGSVPFVYYAFDYSMAVYSDNWGNLTGPVIEFLPAFLCLAFVIFCFTYQKAYEEKRESERREQIVRIMVEQQSHEVEAMRRGENEIRMIRHDLRLLLGNLMHCLNEDDTDSARKLLGGYLEDIDKTIVRRFCKNDIINYVVSDFCARCERKNIPFKATITADKLDIDDLLLASLLSNALENALNAQEGLEPSDCQISLSIATSNDRLLLMLSNTYANKPEFVDGMPVSHKEGHGYGTQSIRYMAERLGGSCQFSLEDSSFVLRVAINL